MIKMNRTDGEKERKRKNSEEEGDVNAKDVSRMEEAIGEMKEHVEKEFKNIRKEMERIQEKLEE